VNILDENIVEDECRSLRSRRVHVRHIGHDISHKGIKDQEIVPLLHRLRRPTLFSHDTRFFNRRLCHPSYCLVYLDVPENAAAVYVRRVLRHPLLNTQVKRMGTVVRASSADIRLLRRHGDEEILTWPD
jgi:hypothetical protein